MDRDALLAERNRLLDMYVKARHEEQGKILARLFVIDDELGGVQNKEIANILKEHPEEIGYKARKLGLCKNGAINMAQGKKRSKNEKNQQKLESLCFHCANGRADRCEWIGRKKKIWDKAVETTFMADRARNREITIYKVTNCARFVKEAMRT